MTDDEFYDLSRQLAEAVARRCQHIIHVDDPIMAVAVMVQVIAGHSRAEQERLLGEFTQSVLTGALQAQVGMDKTARSLLESLRTALGGEIETHMQRAFTDGGATLQELIRCEAGKALMVLRSENLAARRIRQAAQVALAASALSLLGGLTAFIAIILR